MQYFPVRRQRRSVDLPEKPKQASGDQTPSQMNNKPNNFSTSILAIVLASSPSAASVQASAGRAPANSSNGPDRPNVVLFLIDDFGWADLGLTGSTFYETPNVDALAAEGVFFSNAYAANPVCSPTRASI